MASSSSRLSILPLLILIFHLSVPLRCCFGERTLAMIKPDGIVGNHTHFIKTTILASSFTILQEITLQLDRHTAQGFYAEHSSRTFFPDLIDFITRSYLIYRLLSLHHSSLCCLNILSLHSSAPVLIMVLDKVSAVSDWRALIGPTDASKAKLTHPHSIRAMCGVNVQRNCVHGSDSTKSAAREISFFFNHTDSGGNVSEHDEL
nr:PREDICTED: probable nucleoside diphosphate kinase 5 isoform X2 [Daucus carota subsp. sativus]